MTTEATDSALITTSAVDPEIAAAIRIHDRLTPVKDALGISDLSDQEVSLFAMVAQRSRLDPFAKQIYAIKRAGKVSYQTGIDGYRSIAARTSEYGGSDEATFEWCDCTQAPQPHPSVARVVIHRIRPDGRMFDQVGIARWHELKPDAGANKADARWIQMPTNQLAKCAEANGLRKAFPTVLADIYITDEMEQAGPGENARLVEAASQPTPADRIAARRAAVEGQVTAQGDPGNPVAEDDHAPIDFDDVLEGEATEIPTAPQDEAVPGVETPGAEEPAISAASSVPAGYAAFKARVTAADPRPTEADVRKAAKKHEGAIPDIGFKPIREWPLTDGAWKALGDALNLPAL